MKANKKKVSVFMLFTVGIALLGAGAFFVLEPANSNTADAVKKESGNRRSPDVGQEDRDIKSLSDKDIEALELGSGTALNGMAKPAELNGYP